MSGNGAEVLLVLVSMAGLVGLVAIIGGFLHYRRERVLLHAERMKALELGQPIPEDRGTTQQKAVLSALSDPPESDPDRAMARKCFSTAIWVAFWGFLFAGGSASSSSERVAFVIAFGTGTTALAAVIGGSVLAHRASVMGKSRQAETFTAKGPYEPDAYDVVGSRAHAS